jgi:hypothetical protein
VGARCCLARGWDGWRGTKKEGVVCTYKLHEGYAPIFACLGQEGQLVHGELRPGDQENLRLRLPESEIATWWTSLGPRQATPAEVIELYHQHGTSEQFHAELKTEMDLERLPSGKFATNALMLSLGLVAYYLLRLCGQTALAEDERLPPEQKPPLSKRVSRRRLRSVLQDLMYFAARLTRHARRLNRTPSLKPPNPTSRHVTDSGSNKTQ